VFMTTVLRKRRVTGSAGGGRVPQWLQRAFGAATAIWAWRLSQSDCDETSGNMQIVMQDRFFHVTSSFNRSSILEHGLDWTRMAAAHGIAGSRAPEQEGCFVCLDEDEVGWFVRMNNTGGPVDVWAVDGVDREELCESPEGHLFVPRCIPPRNVELVRRDIAPIPRHWTGPADKLRAVKDAGSDRGTGLFFEL